MPNGFHGSSEAWERMEAPLRALDPVLEDFAARHGTSLCRMRIVEGWSGQDLEPAIAP